MSNLEYAEPGSVSLIIGVNGSGKSTFLNSLSKMYVSNGQRVIAIANTIHDKFSVRSNHFKLLSNRSGRTVCQRTIKKALINISNGDHLATKKIGLILDYLGYDAQIGVKIDYVRGFNVYDFLESLDSENDQDYGEIEQLLYRLFERTLIDETYWVQLDGMWFDPIDGPTLSNLLAFESKLKKIGAIRSMTLFLTKKNEEIELSKASSGELSFLTSMIYISTEIDRHTIIVVDEPENSLHPQWQREYISKVMDLFHYYEPSVICATHSPIFISGAEISERSVNIYRSIKGRVEKVDSKTTNMEQLLWEIFEIVSPENRFLSSLVKNKFNLLAEGEVSLSKTIKDLEELEEAMYDSSQREVMTAAKQLAYKIHGRS